MSFRDHDYRAHSVNFNVPTIMSLDSYHDCTLAYLIYKKYVICDVLNKNLSTREPNYVLIRLIY